MFRQTQVKIQNWHTQQGHTNETTQLTKLIEELGEVAKELNRNNEQAIKTELGDVLIVLISLDQINENKQNLAPFLNVNIIPCADKSKFLVHHMHNELRSYNTTAHGINFAKRLGYDPTECLVLAWEKEQVKVSSIKPEPLPEDFGFYTSTSPEEQSGWQLEGGEELYYEAHAEWSKFQSTKPKLIRGFEFINRYELLLNGMIVFGDNELVNFMPVAPYQSRELKTSPMRIGNVEPNRWFISNNSACLILSTDGVNASYNYFMLKENGGFEMRSCLAHVDGIVNLIH